MKPTFKLEGWKARVVLTAAIIQLIGVALYIPLFVLLMFIH